MGWEQPSLVPQGHSSPSFNCLQVVRDHRIGTGVPIGAPPECEAMRGIDQEKLSLRLDRFSIGSPARHPPLPSHPELDLAFLYAASQGDTPPGDQVRRVRQAPEDPLRGSSDIDAHQQGPVILIRHRRHLNYRLHGVRAEECRNGEGRGHRRPVVGLSATGSTGPGSVIKTGTRYLCLDRRGREAA